MRKEENKRKIKKSKTLEGRYVHKRRYTVRPFCSGQEKSEKGIK